MRNAPGSIRFAGPAAAAFILVWLLASMVGGVAKTWSGDRSKERLQLVFPSIMNMPVSDRVLLVDLAMTCHLEQRQAARTEVTACLRKAVDDPHATFPNGVNRDGARARLNQLLHQRYT